MTVEADHALAFANLRTALEEYLEQPAQTERWTKLLATRRAASDAIIHLPRKETQGLATLDALQLVREMSASGAHDSVVDAADLARAQAAVAKGWPGLLAAMLLVPAWQWPEAPALQGVSEWLQADYVAWLFASPKGFSAVGQAEVYAAYSLRRLEELVRWVNRAPAVALLEAVLNAYVLHGPDIPLYFSTGDLRRHAELRGRLWLRAYGQPGDTYEAVAQPRAGRRLRVGILNRHFGPQTETFTTLPTFEELDPERFEVILFAHQSGDSALEAYCRGRAANFFVLPEDLEGQLAMLRAAALDVAVFGTNVTAVCTEVARIALHRVAPLQVVNNSSCITSGLAEADLYVSGAMTEAAAAAAHFSERLGLLPGPAHAFNYEAGKQAPESVRTRADYGLPDDACVFVSAANYFKIVPEMQHAWARLLAAVPGSRLLVHPFNPNWSKTYPISRFRAEFGQVLASHGVDAARLVVSTDRFPSRSDVKALLSLGDIYLDTFPFGGVNSLVDPLELGQPPVAWEGGSFRSRMGAALLRALNLPELIATNADDYHAIVVKLATHPAHRQAVAARIRAQMECAPVFLDVLAASDAFGDLIETAYDELAAVGRAAFRANPAPVRAGAAAADSTSRAAADAVTQARQTLRRTPNDAAARHIVGRAMLDAGRTGRAVTYLLAALQGQESNAGLWLDLATALRADGQMHQAIQALEAGLRVDSSQLEGWLMLAELAQAVGVNDLAREAAEVAQRLAPADPRAAAYV